MSDLENVDWDLRECDTDIYASQIHPYPAKFIPQIPSRFIEEYTEEGDVVLDPFNGSGNSTMMAGIKNRKGYGFDLNPLSCMIARAKIRDYDMDYMNSKFKELSNNIDSNIDVVKKDKKYEGHVEEIENVPVDIPDIPDRYSWFVPEVLNQIGLIKHHIDSIDDKAARCFYHVNLSSVLKRVCRSKEDYTFIGDNMLPDSETNQLEPDNEVYNVLDEFENKVEKNLERIRKVSSEDPVIPKISCMDFRKSNLDEEVDLTVTSPPYACAVDYARYHRLSFYLFGFPVGDTRDDEIGARSKRGRKNAVQDYLDEVRTVYERVYNYTKSGGKFVIVVGDSQRKNKKLEIPQKTLKICEDIGFSHNKTIEREISGQSMGQKKIKKEDMIILEK